MDRPITYDGALPQTTDILNAAKFAMVAQAYQNRAAFGTSTTVSGLACLPTSPTPDLHVSVGVGSIYQMDPTDATAYGDLGVDNNNIVKQGILPAPVVLTLTPPSTSGFSQVFLVEAILNDIDAGLTTLSYYNSANPAAPFAGPAGSNISQFTIRSCVCAIALKAGIAATTGTQTTPPPDAGFVPLYAITVANGVTQVTSGNIVTQALAPFFPTLPQVPAAVQNGTWVYCVDTGTANHLIVTPPNNPQALVTGMGFRVKVLTNCSGASDITINYVNSSGVAATLGPVTIHRGSTAGITTGDLVSGGVADLVYDGTFFQMANYMGSGTNTNTNTTIGIPYVADSGTVNNIVATFAPTILPLTPGETIAVKLANTIAGGVCVINCNGGGNKNVVLGDLSNPPFNIFVAGMVLVMEYDGTQFQIINTSAGMFYRQPTANYNIYVNTSTGSDTLYNGFSATVSGSQGPFKTIQKALNVAWSYAPSSTFIVTINIASGSYNENPQTPSNPAGNIVINGAGIGSTIIASTSSSLTAFVCTGPTSITFQNLTLSGNSLAGLVTEFGANVTVSNVAFNNNIVSGSHVQAVYFGFVSIGSGVVIGGNCNSVFLGQSGGSVGFQQVAITISSGIGVASGFCYAVNGGTVTNGTAITPPSFVNPGFVSGPKYLATGNGVVWAQGQGVNFYPGNVAGSTQSGGQYIP